jgi:DNA polymerase elongation subunit (family B)
MSKFYTNVTLIRNDIYLRGYENGQRVQHIVPYKPYLFIHSKGVTATEYRNLKGTPVDKINFDSISEARDFIKRYGEVSGMTVYGMTNFVYPFINDYYPGTIEYDPKQISVVNIDIEVAADQGFPNIANANKPITAITMKKDDTFIVLGFGEFATDDPKVKYIKCKDETELLIKFLDVWRSKWFSPDVVTGWNVEFFDIPYIVNRIKRVLGESMAKKISPWEIIQEKEVTVGSRPSQMTYLPAGIAVLDYMQLYRKFSFTNQESYSLNHIANAELGEKKMDYSEYDSLFDLYKKDYQKFIEYNIRDVELVSRLDDKLKFIEQVFALAYDGKVNYQETFTTVRMWDTIIHNYLLAKNIVVPQLKVGNKLEKIVGGYVKDPQDGLHKWVVSFDLNSLYPHIIMQYNISPETYVGKVPYLDGEEGIQRILDGAFYEPSIRNQLESQNLCITGTGCMFDKDRIGFLPELMDRFYKERSTFKKRMIEAEKAYQLDPSEENKKAIAQNHNMQIARKYQLNSVYGALSNEYFRWYDDKLAESITLSGQLATRWIEREMNKYLNKLLKTSEEDYVIACDTDSMYITLDKLVSHLSDAKLTTADTVSIVDKFCQDKLEPYINSCFERLSGYVNAYAQKMQMKREAIADKAIWTAKKRYIMNVWNNEGVSYSEPKLKIKGLEAVKSSTPSSCRDNIKKCINIIMSGSEDDVITFIENFRKEFVNLSFEEIAFPRGVKLTHIVGDSRVPYKLDDKGLPINVRAALVYNEMLKNKKLDQRFPLVQDGDKIKYCYMKLPNPVRENVFGCPGTLPRQLGMEQYIDYDMQYDKAFVEPIKSILDAIGWRVEKTASLESFFA